MTDETLPSRFQHLQIAFEITLERYHRFLQTDSGDDPKRVTAHHQAGKSAVAHMTALIKLLKIFGKNSLGNEKEADLEALLLQARSVLAVRYDDQENQL